MKNVMMILMLFVLCACQKNKVPTLEFYGSANSFVQTESKAFGGAAVIENSMVYWNGELTYFYDPNYNATMVMHNSSGSQQVMSANARFSYVLTHNGVLYAYVTRGDVYLLTSTDGITWQEQGVVAQADADPASPYHQLWNPGVAVDDSGTWHMLIEASDATPGQGNVGLVHLTSPDGVNFTKHGVVIPHGGNPFIANVPGKGLVVIHGQSGDPQAPFGTEWYVTATTFDGTTWTTHKDKFLIGASGVHVCDPHAIETPTGILLTMSVDQNSIYKTEAKGETFSTLFDKLNQ